MIVFCSDGKLTAPQSRHFCQWTAPRIGNPSFCWAVGNVLTLCKYKGLTAHYHYTGEFVFWTAFQSLKISTVSLLLPTTPLPTCCQKLQLCSEPNNLSSSIFLHRILFRVHLNFKVRLFWTWPSFPVPFLHCVPQKETWCAGCQLRSPEWCSPSF